MIERTALFLILLCFINVYMLRCLLMICFYYFFYLCPSDNGEWCILVIYIPGGCLF